ncbi:MAG: hypothetical protein QY332_12180 [Anaerolineales bacterium]|nr:MAG: hypothetical protein QY332_12180 [Anaerolineales bacterium]
MTENALQIPPEPAAPPNGQSARHEQTDRYKTMIIVLTLITTIVTAIVASLQADANIRANTANRNSQYYALLVSGEIHRQGLQNSYDFDILTEHTRLTQEALVLQITALELEGKNDRTGASASSLSALGAQARADKIKSFSIFYTDPRYAPITADGTPNFDAYLANVSAQANELTGKQNSAADEYHRWNGKADSYVSVLTVLAVAFFLLGLAQALKSRMRLTFAIFGGIALGGAGAWAVLILIL